MGNEKDATLYKKKLSDFQKNSASSIEKALLLKEQGNGLFKLGDFLGASSKYQESLVLDATNESVWSNLSLMFIRLKRFQDAVEAAERSTLSNPNWAKGWIRKGIP